MHLSSLRIQRINSDQILSEHRIDCEREEINHITYSSSSSGASSIYSSDDSSVTDVSFRDEFMHTRRAIAAFPDAVNLPERIMPHNFGIITKERVFRSSYPSEPHFEFLEALELRTIITLVDEPVPDEYRKWMKKHNIKHHTALVTPNKEHKNKRTEVEQIAKVLDLMMDPMNQPVLIHCNKGKHRSGCVTAAFRRCNGLPIEQIIDEYISFAGDKARELDIAFIKAFDASAYLCNLRRDTLMETMPVTCHAPTELTSGLSALEAQPVRSMSPV